jgi:tripartite-type tricarboxylate transporter receptor subunit TctC
MQAILRLARVAGALAIAAVAGTAIAQSWPSRPVRVINPFPPGGGTDTFARPLSAKLSMALGQQFVVDNRGGAGGTIGADIAAKSPADGHTVLMGAVHHTIAVSLYKKLPYDLEKDLVPVTLVARVPNVVVVHPSLPIHSIAELIDYAKKNPNGLSYGSAGNGTSQHLAAELFKVMTKTEMQHVPYKGMGPAMQDLLAGQIQLVFDGMGTSAQQIRAAKIRPLAVTTKLRSQAFPAVPTMQESGLPGFEVTTWYGIWAPRGVPREMVDRLQQEVAKAMQLADIREIWASQSSDLGGNRPDEFGEFVTQEIAKWEKVVKASGAQID